MSQAANPPLVEHVVEDDQEASSVPVLSKHTGVQQANRRAAEDLPDWQRFEGDWWETGGELSRVELDRMTRREVEVWRSVEVHGLRAQDLAAELNCDPSTVRDALERARSKRGDRR